VSLLAKAFKLLTPRRPENGGLWPGLVALARTIPGRRGRASRTVARGRHAGRDHAHPITSSPYDIRSHSRPLDSVGGDWSGLVVEGDASLWAIVADVTGHGFPAYLVADGLPHLWGMRSTAALRARGCTPHELLDALSDVLEPFLPEAVFVEGTLARFTPTGRAAFSGAGFCRMARRRSGEYRIELHHFGGPYPGLGSCRSDHPDWAVGIGGEVMMASDGLFEQPDSDSPQGQLEASLARRAKAHLAAGYTLHEATLAVLEEVLRGGQQRDDLTVLTIGYRQQLSAGRGTEHVPV
jgi:serine phosphatase RsbU (regulator of sigma subunit)